MVAKILVMKTTTKCLSKTKINPCKEISITELSFLKGWPLNLVSHLNQLAKGNLTKENMLSFAHITYSNYHLTTTEVSVVTS